MQYARLGLPGMKEKFYYFCVIGTLRMLFALLTRVRRRRADIIPPAPYVLAGNHVSHFDPPVMAAYYRQKIDFMAMVELFGHPLLQRFFEGVGTFKVDRGKADMRAVRTALTRLKKGRIVGIFPEGGLRSGVESVLQGKALPRGAASLAVMAGVPVVPCVLLGTDQMYQWRSIFRQPRIFVEYGRPLFPDGDLPKDEAIAELNGRLELAMRDIYESMKQWPGFHPGMLSCTAQERWAQR